jgi:glycine/D-amino acid oxidase-like deaminating enzyme
MKAHNTASGSVVVVGGGVIGMCVALSLQDRGFDVTVADQDSATPPASWGNAGRIAVEPSEPLSSPATLRSLPKSLFFRGGPVGLPPSAIATWLPFAARFIAASTPKRFRYGTEALNSLLVQALPAWRRRLSAIGASELLIEAGHYAIWEHADSSASGRQAWIRKSGSATAMDLNSTEIDRLRSLLNVPIAGSLKSIATANIADPADLLTTMQKAFLKAGGHLDTCRLTLAAALQMADIVVVAAGVESADLLEAIGHTVPMIAERGYHIQQSGASWPHDIPPIHFEDRSVVVTRFRSALRATSFLEFTKKDAAPDARKWARLRQHARELGLPFDDSATQWMGSRPTLPDYLPAIGRSRRLTSVFYAFGHQHLGLTLAALTGELTAALVSEETAAVNLEPFDINRFAWSP